MIWVLMQKIASWWSKKALIKVTYADGEQFCVRQGSKTVGILCVFQGFDNEGRHKILPPNKCVDLFCASLKDGGLNSYKIW